MANWASTSYRIESKQKDLQEIYDLFMQFNENGRTPFDNLTDKNWEGNIVWALGGDTNNYYLRGFIQSCEISEGMLSIEAEEAWGASDFRHFLENHYKDMKVYFMVEEDGDCVYATNDSAAALWLILVLMGHMTMNASIRRKKPFIILLSFLRWIPYQWNSLRPGRNITRMRMITYISMNIRLLRRIGNGETNHLSTI